MAALTGQVVDTSSAQEFHREITTSLTPEQSADLVAGLVRKAELFASVLGPGTAVPDIDDLYRLMRCVFASRRVADAMIADVGEAEIVRVAHELVHSTEELATRFDRFTDLLGNYPDRAADLASELLHFSHPDRYWLWTRWMWDPEADTGALRLVTTEETDLYADGVGATYLAVGQATAFVHETGTSAGFSAAGTGLFGTDVFLAAVYGVYMNTVLRMRMTQEFTRMVPELPRLVRRLLGVHYLEV